MVMSENFLTSFGVYSIWVEQLEGDPEMVKVGKLPEREALLTKVTRMSSCLVSGQTSSKFARALRSTQEDLHL